MTRRFRRGQVVVSPRAAARGAAALFLTALFLTALFLTALGLGSAWAVAGGERAPTAPAPVDERVIVLVDAGTGCAHGSMGSGGSPRRPCHDAPGACCAAHVAAVVPPAARSPERPCRSDLGSSSISECVPRRPPLRTSLGRAPPFTA